MKKLAFKIVFLPAFIVLVWAAGYAAFVASVVYEKPQMSDISADVIVVTTGGDKRIEEGLALFARGASDQLFITGVHPGVTHNTIIGMWHGKSPLPACCITLGHKADSTIGNAREAREWLEGKDYKTIILVTANYHMNRAWIEMAHQLPGRRVLRHPVLQPGVTPGKRRFWTLTLEEYHKTIFRLVSLVLKLPESYAEEFSK